MITKIAIKVPLRGFGWTGPRQATKFLVELDGDKRMRRVYDRYIPGTSRPAVFVPVIKDGSGTYRDLTKEEAKLIGYAFETCRQLTGEELDNFSYGKVLTVQRFGTVKND